LLSEQANTSPQDSLTYKATINYKKVFLFLIVNYKKAKENKTS